MPAITAAPKDEADFLLQRSGSLVIFLPQTDAAVDKVPDLGLEEWNMLGEHQFAVEVRHGAALAAQLSDEGFSFADTD
jgi:hypothetical protein